MEIAGKDEFMSSPLPHPGPLPRLEPYGPEHLPFGFGMTSLVLGAIALAFNFLPVLGAPLSGFGLFFGLVGVVVALRQGGARLRWSIMGIGASVLALMVNVAISYSPWGYAPQPREVPQLWRRPPDRPYVPPPEPANDGPLD
jgi:hypothetical protein